MIPPRRQAVLDFIKGEIAAGRPFPRPMQVARHMGWRNVSSASEALELLASRDRALVTHRDHMDRKSFSLRAPE